MHVVGNLCAPLRCPIASPRVEFGARVAAGWCCSIILGHQHFLDFEKKIKIQAAEYGFEARHPHFPCFRLGTFILPSTPATDPLLPGVALPRSLDWDCRSNRWRADPAVAPRGGGAFRKGDRAARPSLREKLRRRKRICSWCPDCGDSRSFLARKSGWAAASLCL